MSRSVMAMIVASTKPTPLLRQPVPRRFEEFLLRLKQMDATPLVPREPNRVFFIDEKHRLALVGLAGRRVVTAPLPPAEEQGHFIVALNLVPTPDGLLMVTAEGLDRSAEVGQHRPGHYILTNPVMRVFRVDKHGSRINYLLIMTQRCCAQGSLLGDWSLRRRASVRGRDFAMMRL